MRRRNNELLLELVHTTLGYWRAQVLLSANELDVFNALDGHPMTAAEIAGRVHTNPDYTERLLNACVATQLLKKEDGRYSNLPMADSLLVAGRPQYMGNWIRLMAAWYKPFGELSTAIRTGKPVEDPMRHLGDDADYTRAFILAMHDYAMGPGKELVHHLDLAGRTTLLDLGGGAGSYSILLARAYDQLRPVVYDLPAVVEIARETIADSGLSHRIEVRGGDYTSDDLGSGYDVLLMSNMLYQEDRASCLALLQKAHAALVDGGQLILQAMFLNRDKDGPAWPALQSLITLLVYHEGRTYSLDETVELITEAGFVDIDVRKMSLLNAGSIVVASKA